MATSSFNKDFTITSEKAIDCIADALLNSDKTKNKKTSSISYDDIKRGEEKLKKILSR